MDAHEIIPGLWQGSKPPQGHILRLKGFGSVVLCAREHQPEAGLFPGVQVIHAPNDDAPHIEEYRLTRDKLAVALQAAHQVVADIQKGQKVLVTCAAGKNRSGLVSALVIHLQHGLPGDRCIQQVRRKRKTYDGYPALSNHEFTAALRNLR